MKYLFQASIGPVQDFIASARRSRDLFFGSWLLSELSKAAAKRIVDDKGILIFPAPDLQNMLDALNPGSELNVANKILAIIEGEPEELGKKIYTAIIEQLREIRDNAYKQIRDSSWEGSDKEKIANAQVDDLVEYYCAAVEYDGFNYAEKREKLERLMAARKNTRNFQRVKWGSQQPKSSIDGQLESVIPEYKYAPRNDSPDEKAKILYDQYGAGSAERLSGVDLLKRRGETKPISFFPSTSHIATIPFLDRLNQLDSDQNHKAKEKWNTYVEEVQKLSENRLEYVSGLTKEEYHKILGKLEGSLLFEERMRDLLDFVKDRNSEQAKKVKQALQEFYECIDKQLGIAKPDPYYALLHADGDHMGQTIDHFAEQGYEQHQQLSRKLDTFARRVRDVVKKHEGALVYSGGDDVLAFLPLHTVLQCAKELAKDFSEKLSAFQYTKDKSPSLSVGVAIVHHLHPLSDALNIARTAEKKAKEAGRNALAVTVNKRSGGEYTSTGHWNVIDGQLEKLIEYTDTIPSGTAYELQDMLQRLSFSTGDSVLQDAMQAEVRRILQRKLNTSEEKIRKKTEEKAIQAYLDLLTMVGIPLPKLPENTVFSPTVALIDGKQPSERIEQLISMLLVARVFADAQKLAKIK